MWVIIDGFDEIMMTAITLLLQIVQGSKLQPKL